MSDAAARAGRIYEFDVLLYPERDPDTWFVSHTLTPDIVTTARSQIAALMQLIDILKDMIDDLSIPAFSDRPVEAASKAAPWSYHVAFEQLAPFRHPLIVADEKGYSIVLNIRESLEHVCRQTAVDDFDSGDPPPEA